MLKIMTCEPDDTRNARFMGKALEQARKALSKNEFPVGCVLVHEEQVIAAGSRRGTAGGPASELDHAEILALRELDDLRLNIHRSEITLFCTMEPCLMCYAAILLNGIGRIVYAFEDAMGGGTRCDLSALPPLYGDRAVPITPHVLREESLRLFQTYFIRPENDYWRGSYLSRYTLAQVPGSPPVSVPF
jgi:tRNA(adenine34) deaminase